MNGQSDQPNVELERARAVSERAYAIWEQEGRPEGRDQQHWLQAERERDDFGTALPPGQAPSPASQPPPRRTPRAKARVSTQRTPTAAGMVDSPKPGERL